MRMKRVQTHGLPVQLGHTFWLMEQRRVTNRVHPVHLVPLPMQRISFLVRHILLVARINMFRLMEQRQRIKHVPTRKQMVQLVQRVKNARAVLAIRGRVVYHAMPMLMAIGPPMDPVPL